MYKAKLWDEDKWNIHSQSYNSSKYGNIFSEGKKEDKKYHEQKYGSEKDAKSDYMRKEEQKDADDKKINSMFDDVEEQKSEKQELKDEDVTFKAAKQIFNENRFSEKKPEPKKDLKTIDDAIKKAIEDEKKVFIAEN